MDKLTVMRENPNLFKKIQETVSRAEHLMATVNLCDNGVELYLFEFDRSGIFKFVYYPGYSRKTLRALNSVLDARAAGLKDIWSPEYAKLDESAVSGWSLDLTGSDYAEIIIGDDVTNERHYRMDWCFDDLVATAQYISAYSNPSAEALERFIQKKRKKGQKKKTEAC